jgi:hypothetical protein
MSTEEFERIEGLAAIARHPRFKRPYTDVVYQPMVELLAYLRANGFKTYIVSGGGASSAAVDREGPRLPPEQVVGSTRSKYVFDGGAELGRQKPPSEHSRDQPVDDNVGKPVGIQQFIGRELLAVGNPTATSRYRGPRPGAARAS